MPNLDFLEPWRVLLGWPIHENGTFDIHKRCFFFSLSSYIEGSFSLNRCIKLHSLSGHAHVPTTFGVH